MLRATLILLLLTAPLSAQDNARPNVEPRSLEARVHELINAERIRLKLKPLKIDEKLSSIARRHSEDMGRRSFFDHVNPDGKNPTDRGRAAGYTCRKDFGEYVSEGLAENIFQNNLYNRVTILGTEMTFDWNTPEKIALSSVDGWMLSPGHRRNILNRTYQKTGIGVAIAANDQVLITQMFC
jgi:uncharacterized protein YkwD